MQQRVPRERKKKKESRNASFAFLFSSDRRPGCCYVFFLLQGTNCETDEGLLETPRRSSRSSLALPEVDGGKGKPKQNNNKSQNTLFLTYVASFFRAACNFVVFRGRSSFSLFLLPREGKRRTTPKADGDAVPPLALTRQGRFQIRLFKIMHRPAFAYRAHEKGKSM